MKVKLKNYTKLCIDNVTLIVQPNKRIENKKFGQIEVQGVVIWDNILFFENCDFNNFKEKYGRCLINNDLIAINIFLKIKKLLKKAKKLNLI